MARDAKIDNLKVLGILLVILAHCVAPEQLNTFRCFDVILLVFLNALVSSTNQYSSLNEFSVVLKKKCRRLLLPTYVFIFLFAPLLFFAYRIVGKSDLFGIKQIFNSLFLCEDSVGYVWIIKVYLVNALLIPFINKVLLKCHSNKQYLLGIVLEFLIYTFLVNVYCKYLSESYPAWIIFNEWIICVSAHAFVAQEALWNKRNKKWKKYGWIFWLCLLLLSSYSRIDGFLFDPMSGKRPPNLHYISWGLLMTELLYLIVPNRTTNVIEWLSKHSLEVYLVHPFLILAFTAIETIFAIEYPAFWVLKWIITVVLSICIVIIFAKIKKQILKR